MLLLDRNSSERSSAMALDRQNSRGVIPNPSLNNNGNGVAAPVLANQQRGGALQEKFRAVVREREEELNRTLRDEEIIVLYREALSELIFNSKPVITDLTIIAGELVHLAQDVANAVCNHVLEVPVDQKLPSLYLLDSIVKNIGGEYVKYFAARLPEVFIKSYQQVDPNLHHSMKRLFHTWRVVFPQVQLHLIEAELNFPPSTASSASAVTSRPQLESHAQSPGHSIHVNPKYLVEARQPFKHSRTEASNSGVNEELSSPERSSGSIHESPKVWHEPIRRSASSHRSESTHSYIEHGYAPKSSTGYGESDYSISPQRTRAGRSISPRMGIPNPHSPLARLRTTGRVGSPPRGAPMVRASSPPRLPSIGRDPSPSVSAGRGLPPPRTTFGRVNSPATSIGRRSEGAVETDNGWERPWSAKGEINYARPLDRVNPSIGYGHRNGYAWRPQVMPGALIDAYGNYRGQRSLTGPLSYLHPPQENDILSSSRALSRNWRNSEEEEYSWENLSPRAGTHTRGIDESRKEDVYVGEKLPVVDVNNRMDIDSADSDEWHMPSSLSHSERQDTFKESLPQRESESQPYNFSQPGIPSGNKEALSELPSAMQESSLGSRSTGGRPQSILYHNHNSVLQQNIKSYPHVQGNVSMSNSIYGYGKPSSLENDSKIGNKTNLSFGKHSKPASNAQQFTAESGGSDNIPPMNASPSQMSFQRQQPVQKSLSPSLVPQSVRPPLHHITSLPPAPFPPPAPLPPAALSSQPQFHPVQKQTNSMTTVQPQVSAPFNSQNQLSQAFHQHPHHQRPAQMHNQLFTNSQRQALHSLAQTDIIQISKNNSMGNQISATQEAQLTSASVSQPHSRAQGMMHGGHASQPLQQTSEGTNMLTSQLGSGTAGPLLPTLLSNLLQKIPGGINPPLPPGLPPPPSMMSSSPMNPSAQLPTLPANVSSLLNSLMAQGVISAEVPKSSSLPPLPTASSITQSQQVDNPAKVSAVSTLTSTISVNHSNDLPRPPFINEPGPHFDDIGTEFSSDVLKTRHEHVLRSLYEDLPRQCTTCGLRFKLQEDHSNHMDWHVSRNRTISKNRKQRVTQIHRKWFVSFKDWLSGTEATTSEVVPPFSPMEAVPEKKEEEELCVPADEEQSLCALCGEPFEDFYSDERDEWMYKGAVYMNAPSGQYESIDKSQLGEIVHAKCRSDSVGSTLDSREEDVDGSDNPGVRPKKARHF